MHAKSMLGWLCAALLSHSSALLAEPAQLKALKLDIAGQGARLLFELSAAPANFGIAQDKSPERLSLQFEKTDLAAKLVQPTAGNPYIGRISATDDRKGLTVTVDLKAPMRHRIIKTRNGFRLILERDNPNRPAALGKPVATGANSGDKRAQGSKTGFLTVKNAPAAPKEYVIAIDAGHGGKDTGAIGPNGTREKDVVIAIAQRLKDQLEMESDMHPILVRKGDKFIDLRQRTEIARKARADLFISLHADSYVSGEVRGSSVFTLSRHGATSVAARWLADRENSADLVGGVKLNNKNKLLASVLLDLSQSATLEASDRAANRILKELQKTHRLHHQQVQKAGFAVLKSPDVPSLLIETGFISNPDEERNLGNQEYQELVARSIYKGVRAYFANNRRTTTVHGKELTAEASFDAKPIILAAHP